MSVDDELTGHELTGQDLPSFRKDFDWSILDRLTKDKWAGIRQRVLGEGGFPRADKPEQVMYLDLMDEVVHLAHIIQNLGLESVEPATLEVALPFSRAELQVALMGALAGTEIDTDSAHELMALTSTVVDAVLGEGS